MGTKLTLSELKAQNTSEENLEEDPKQAPIKDDIEVEDDGLIEEALEEELEEENLEDDDEDEDETEGELEDWQQSEDSDPDNGKKKSGFVPNAGAAKLRQKLKAEKQESKGREAELQAEIDRLKVSSAPTAAEEVLPPRPTLEGFDYDQERYDHAVDSWNDKRIDQRINSHTDSLQQSRLHEAQQKAAEKRTDDAVTGHLDRAATLITEGKIKEKAWLEGDMKIREALESVVPTAGDAIADQFISLLDSNGPGSEKAWYYVGQNPKALAELKEKLSTDTTGAQAVMYLASIQNTATQSIRKKRSGAPQPSPRLKGDALSGSAKSSKKQYDKSSSPGDRIKLKRQAKKAGTDVSNW